MNYFALTILALAPSFIWLIFFLRKDVHPESNKMILRIFLYGMIITLPAILIETGFSYGTRSSPLSLSLIFFLNTFIGVAFIEEFLKYLVFKEKVVNNSHLDEPTDVMLYMITAALGFAAFENILVFFQLDPSPFLIQDIFFLSLLRFISATFLHALASGLLGYFLALSFLKTKQRGRLIFTGLSLATLLHGFYNLSIIKIGESIDKINGGTEISNYQQFIFFTIILTSILIGLALFVSLGFRKLKELKGICEI